MTWRNHNGVKYLYLDYRGIKDLEIMDLILELTQIIEDVEDGTLNMIINSKGANFTFWSYSLTRDVAKKAQPKINKSCYVGVNNYSKAIHHVYKAFTGSKALFFDTLEEGLKYMGGEE